MSSSLNGNKITIFQITACNNGRTNALCLAAQSFFNNNVLQPLLAGSFDVCFLTSK